MSESPNRLTIDLAALGRNLTRVKEQITPNTKVMGIVKSDAYGHGLVPVARALEKEGADCLGVAFIGEALKLRSAGIALPIIVLSGLQNTDDARNTAQNGLTPVISDYSSAGILDREGSRLGKKIPVHIKIDTGMGRLGIPHTETGAFLERIIPFDHIDIEGLCSHLSSADEAESGFTRMQIRYFREAILTGRSLGLNLPLNHLANSAGIMAYKDSHFNMVRPGIMLYGGYPSPDFRTTVRMEAVMKFSASVLQVRDFPEDTPLSYARTYRTKGQEQVAVVSAGYGDGLSRHLSNRGWTLIKGRKAPVLGRICMNMLLCNVSGIAGVLTGDEVVLLGSMGNEMITGDDLALWGDSISYEIFCSLGCRHDKVYLNENQTEIYS
jgi:alanine racemase